MISRICTEKERFWLGNVTCNPRQKIRTQCSFLVVDWRAVLKTWQKEITSFKRQLILKDKKNEQETGIKVFLFSYYFLPSRVLSNRYVTNYSGMAERLICYFFFPACLFSNVQLAFFKVYRFRLLSGVNFLTGIPQFIFNYFKQQNISK